MKRHFATLFVVLAVQLGCAPTHELTEEEKTLERAQRIERTRVDLVDPIMDMVGSACQEYRNSKKWPYTTKQPGDRSKFASIEKLDISDSSWSMQFRLRSSKFLWTIEILPTLASEKCSFVLRAGVPETPQAVFRISGAIETPKGPLGTEEERQQLATVVYSFVSLGGLIPPRSERSIGNEVGSTVVMGLIWVGFCALLDINSTECVQKAPRF